MEIFFKERGFGHLIGFGKRPAMIIIDFINAFTDPSSPLGSELQNELKATVRLLTIFRKMKCPIYFTSVAYEDTNFKDAGLWALKQEGIKVLKSGSNEVLIDSRLNRRRSEAIIMKKFASAFFGTDLNSRLVFENIDTLVITGCTTSGCVRATAVDGLQNGYRCMIVKEAVGDRAISAHNQSLFDLNAKYADVISVKEAIQYMESLKTQNSLIPSRGNKGR